MKKMKFTQGKWKDKMNLPPKLEGDSFTPKVQGSSKHKGIGTKKKSSSKKGMPNKTGVVKK